MKTTRSTKTKNSAKTELKVVTSPGVEPRLTVPKTDVLPLHHEVFSFRAVNLIGLFFLSIKNWENK